MKDFVLKLKNRPVPLAIYRAVVFHLVRSVILEQVAINRLRYPEDRVAEYFFRSSLRAYSKDNFGNNFLGVLMISHG